MNLVPSHKIENISPENYWRHFEVLLENFCSLAEKENVQLTPYSETNPFQRYRELPEEHQLQILVSFSRYYDACIDSLENGGNLRDTDFRTLWNILKRLGLRPASDLFDLLTDSDVIEIYTSSFLQIYRNLKFLELCSYPLDQVFSYQWPELFQRHVHLNEELFQITSEILQGNTKQSRTVDQDVHQVAEIFSAENRKFWVKHNFISPLFSSKGEVPAFVFSLTADRVEYEH